MIGARNDSAYLFPLAGGDPRPLPTLNPDDLVVRWISDGRSVFVRRGAPGPPAVLERVDLDTGRRQPYRRLMPSDPAGVWAIWQTIVIPDGRSYAYSLLRTLSDLYLVQGLR